MIMKCSSQVSIFVAKSDGDWDRLTMATPSSGLGRGPGFGSWDDSKWDTKQRPEVCLPTGARPRLPLFGTSRPLCEAACTSQLEDETESAGTSSPG